MLLLVYNRVSALALLQVINDQVCFKVSKWSAAVATDANIATARSCSPLLAQVIDDQVCFKASKRSVVLAVFSARARMHEEASVVIILGLHQSWLSTRPRHSWPLR